MKSMALHGSLGPIPDSCIATKAFYSITSSAQARIAARPAGRLGAWR
jgi:hypothetical protein